MAKIMIDCADPNDIKSVEHAIEQTIGNCTITYAKTAEQLIDAGKAKSVSAAAEIIAEDTGETKEAVRHKIRSGKQKIGEVCQQPENTTQQTDTIIKSNGTLCIKCGTRKQHIKNGKLPKNGLCQKCRKKEIALEKQNKLPPEITPEEKEDSCNKEQLTIWKSALLKLSNLVDFLNGSVESKPNIPHDIISQVKFKLLTLNSLFEE